MSFVAPKKVLVDVPDAKFSDCETDVIVTHSLGACIGVCIYDRNKKAGGMLHFQLPSSTFNPDKGLTKPFMFADTGMKLLMQTMISAGCQKQFMSVKIAGGAAMRNGSKNFDIGKRNHLAICKYIEQAGMTIDAEDVGGEIPRTLYLHVGTGKIIMKTPHGSKEL